MGNPCHFTLGITLTLFLSVKFRVYLFWGTSERNYCYGIFREVCITIFKLDVFILFNKCSGVFVSDPLSFLDTYLISDVISYQFFMRILYQKNLF